MRIMLCDVTVTIAFGEVCRVFRESNAIVTGERVPRYSDRVSRSVASLVRVDAHDFSRES